MRKSQFSKFSQRRRTASAMVMKNTARKSKIDTQMKLKKTVKNRTERLSILSRKQRRNRSMEDVGRRKKAKRKRLVSGRCVGSVFSKEYKQHRQQNLNKMKISQAGELEPLFRSEYSKGILQETQDEAEHRIATEFVYRILSSTDNRHVYFI